MACSLAVLMVVMMACYLVAPKVCQLVDLMVYYLVESLAPKKVVLTACLLAACLAQPMVVM